MFGSSTPNASQDGAAGRNVNSELLYILFQHARCAGNQIFDTCILRIPRHFLLRYPFNCYIKCNIGFSYTLPIIHLISLWQNVFLFRRHLNPFWSTSKHTAFSDSHSWNQLIVVSSNPLHDRLTHWRAGHLTLVLVANSSFNLFILIGSKKLISVQVFLRIEVVTRYGNWK